MHQPVRKRRPDFALPPGAKVLRARIPPPRVSCPTVPPGSLLTAFFAVGRPVPWSSPLVCRNGGRVKSKRLIAWQQEVAAAARLALGPSQAPYVGPVELRLSFHLVRRSGSRANPDTTNLQKAAEDAIQGVVIRNDSQVELVRSVRRFDGGNGVHVEVYAL